VREAWNLAGLDLDMESFLEFADRAHLPVRLQQALGGQRGRGGVDAQGSTPENRGSKRVQPQGQTIAVL
jgi:hypothetical protein